MDDKIFKEIDPLGNIVCMSSNTWHKKVLLKPIMYGKEKIVEKSIREPISISQNVKYNTYIGDFGENELLCVQTAVERKTGLVSVAFPQRKANLPKLENGGNTELGVTKYVRD